MKPFSPKELVARVRAVLRRTEGANAAEEIVRSGELEIDIARMRVKIGERAVDLTATEFQILATLARSAGPGLHPRAAARSVHGVAFEAYERAIDTHVRNIRRKVEPVPEEPRYLQTVHGVGYRFTEP